MTLLVAGCHTVFGVDPGDLTPPPADVAPGDARSNCTLDQFNAPDGEPEGGWTIIQDPLGVEVTYASEARIYLDEAGSDVYGALLGPPRSLRGATTTIHLLEVPGGARVLLDAAHNPAGAWVLASYLKREFPEPLPIVFGAMRDKDVALMLKHLLPAASMMIMTEAATSRAQNAEELAGMARKIAPRATIEVEPDPKRALDRAWKRCPVAKLCCSAWWPNCSGSRMC